MVAHETIYKTLFVQSRGVLKKELQKHPEDQTGTVPADVKSTTTVVHAEVRSSMAYR